MGGAMPARQLSAEVQVIKSSLVTYYYLMAGRYSIVNLQIGSFEG